MNNRELRVRMAARVPRSVVRHARDAAPRECCGMLLGDRDGISHAVRVRNIRSDVNQFEADPMTLLRVEKRAAHAGRKIWGYYHSHPTGEPRPSDVDRDALVWPDLPPFFHLIVCPAGRWALYNTRDGAWTPVAADETA